MCNDCDQFEEQFSELSEDLFFQMSKLINDFREKHLKPFSEKEKSQLVMDVMQNIKLAEGFDAYMYGSTEYGTIEGLHYGYHQYMERALDAYKDDILEGVAIESKDRLERSVLASHLKASLDGLPIRQRYVQKLRIIGFLGYDAPLKDILDD